MPVTRLSQAVSMASVQSYELWVLDQLGQDNTPIDCAQLASRDLVPGLSNVQILKGPLLNDGIDELDINDIAIGDRNRIFYADLYDEPGGRGDRVAVACAGGQTISGGKTVTIHLTVTP